MPSLGGWEIVIILAVLLLLFGAKKLPDMARSIGQSARVFKGEMKGLKDDDASRKDAEKPAEQAPAQPAQQPVQQELSTNATVNGTLNGAPHQPAQPVQQPQAQQPGRTDAT